jgi:tRNA pseudouridine32 synthase/23S rRNA pseudouridine746 synthase
MPSLPAELSACFIPLPGRREAALPNAPLAASGFCSECKLPHSLPRTPLAEEVASGLRSAIEASDTLDLFASSPSPSAALSTQRLQRDSGGKMFGVLLCETAAGELGYLRAFSGQFNRIWTLEGWVPPLLDLAATLPHQARVEAQVDALTGEIKTLQTQHALLADHHDTLSRAAARQIDDRIALNTARRQHRQSERQHLPAPAPAESLHHLNNQSRDDKESLRRLRRDSRDTLRPLTEELSTVESALLKLKRARRSLSSQLSLELHDASTLHNLHGAPRSLREAFLSPGIPTGAGDCCAPKLLNFAALHQLRPRSLAEFWMGTPKREGRHHGHFYPSCEEKCAPLLGFMLCGAHPDV